MTGILNFNCATAFLFGLAVSAGAAEVQLSGGNKLSGDVRGIDENRIVTLLSPIAENPLLLKGESVLGVVFQPEKDSSESLPDQRIVLVNGDILPVEVATFSNGVFTASSEDLGSLSIAEGLVRSVQLGVVPERLVYAAGSSFDGWTRDNTGARNWSIEKRGFKVDGQGEISRQFDLPEKFIVKFNFEWTENPRFWVYIADPLAGNRNRVDRYKLEFSQANLSLKRESSGTTKFTQIAIANRSGDRYKGNTVQVEVKFDRSRGLIHLYLNGELEGRYTDPIPDIPQAGGITLSSGAPKGTSQIVSDFRILEWDDRGDRHRAEERGDESADALIGRFGERFGGTLLGIEKGDQSSIFTFKSNFQDEPIKLPGEEVSVIFLASKQNDLAESDTDELVLTLKGNGEIQVKSCEFAEETVKVDHPLLGELKLRRNSITGVTKRLKSKEELGK